MCIRDRDNSDRQLNVDYEEVTVSRRVYRSGESEYLLNGAACRLRDINELFYDTGIGKEGYSIIGQGPVSYTHLDVYKRQVYHGLWTYGEKSAGERFLALAGNRFYFRAAAVLPQDTTGTDCGIFRRRSFHAAVYIACGERHSGV